MSSRKELILLKAKLKIFEWFVYELKSKKVGCLAGQYTNEPLEHSCLVWIPPRYKSNDNRLHLDLFSEKTTYSSVQQPDGYNTLLMKRKRYFDQFGSVVVALWETNVDNKWKLCAHDMQGSLLFTVADVLANINRSLSCVLKGNVLEMEYDEKTLVLLPCFEDWLHVIKSEMCAGIGRVVQQDICTTIPKILHLIWVGKYNLPLSYRRNVDKWKEIMPDWEVRLWTNDDINGYEFDTDTLRMISASKQGAQKADIMRFHIVRKYGGIYMDVDFQPHRSLNDLVENNKVGLVVCHDLEITWEYIASAFVAAYPDHPLMNKACELLKEATLNTEDVHLQTGPIILGRAVVKEDPVLYTVLPVEYLYHNVHFEDRYATHTYANTWGVSTAQNYTFVEIGCCDYYTLIQQANDTDTGLSVEPVSLYLNSLPDLPNVKKIRLAISDNQKEEQVNMFYIHPDTIADHQLPTFLKGCNHVGSPHPLHSKLDVNHLCQEETVVMMSMYDFMCNFQIGKIGLLKINTEGHDIKILRSLRTFLESKTIVRYPNQIRFKTNEMYTDSEVQDIIQQYEELDYKVVERSYFTTVELDV